MVPTLPEPARPPTARVSTAAVIGGAVGGLVGVLSVALTRWEPERIGNLAEWVGGLGTALAFSVGVLVLRSEVEARRDQKKLETIRFVTEQLQNDDERRKLRETLYEKFARGADVADDDYRRAAEDSAHRLNTIGILVLEGVLDRDLVQRNWGEQIARCYIASEPLIAWRKQREEHPQLWDAFRQLAKEALDEGRGVAWRDFVTGSPPPVAGGVTERR